MASDPLVTPINDTPNTSGGNQMLSPGRKYFMGYPGQDLDVALDWVFEQMNLGGGNILASNEENPIDLNILYETEGTFRIFFYENSYDDTKSSNPIEITVVADSTGDIIQRYDINGYTVERKMDITTKEWTVWTPKTEYIELGENDTVRVQKDTMIFRKIDNVQAFFK